VIQTSELLARITRYQLADYEWIAIKPMLPNKPRGVTRVNGRRVLNGIFWALRSGAPWRDLPKTAAAAWKGRCAFDRPAG
jgi:transposase